jgi:hypothetical protein
MVVGGIQKQRQRMTVVKMNMSVAQYQLLLSDLVEGMGLQV